MFFSFDYVIKKMVNVAAVQPCMELWMHLGGLLSTQEAIVASCDSYASFVLSSLLRASINPWLHAARLPFLYLTSAVFVRDAKVVKTHLTFEKFESTGVKKRLTKIDESS